MLILFRTHTNTRNLPCLQHYPLFLQRLGWCWAKLIRPQGQGGWAAHKHSDSFRSLDYCFLASRTIGILLIINRHHIFISTASDIDQISCRSVLLLYYLWMQEPLLEFKGPKGCHWVSFHHWDFSDVCHCVSLYWKVLFTFSSICLIYIYL